MYASVPFAYCIICNDVFFILKILYLLCMLCMCVCVCVCMCVCACMFVNVCVYVCHVCMHVHGWGSTCGELRMCSFLQKEILEILYNAFQLKIPVWTDCYNTALISVGMHYCLYPMDHFVPLYPMDHFVPLYPMDHFVPLYPMDHYLITFDR